MLNSKASSIGCFSHSLSLSFTLFLFKPSERVRFHFIPSPFSSVFLGDMQIFFFLAVLALFAGQGLGLNVNIGGSLGNVSAIQIVDIPAGQLKTECEAACAPAFSAIQACGEDDSCLCKNETAVAIRDCQQCMYAQLIKKNEKMPDPRAGSTPVLGAYAAACLASVNVTIPSNLIGLTVPVDWDGPNGMSMGVPAAVLTVITAALIGVGGISIICSM